MPPLTTPFGIIAAASLLLAASGFGQVQNTDFRILKVEPNFFESPTYSGPRFDKRGPRAKSWLEVEVTFEWQPRLQGAKIHE